MECFSLTPPPPPPLTPVDIMTHVAWRQSGLPPTHVIGAGCNLDSERLAYILKMNLNTHKPAWVIGELADKKCEPETRRFRPSSHRFSRWNLVSEPTTSVVTFALLCSSCDEQHGAERWRSDGARSGIQRHETFIRQVANNSCRQDDKMFVPLTGIQY